MVQKSSVTKLEEHSEVEPTKFTKAMSNFCCDFGMIFFSSFNPKLAAESLKL